jgi:ATP-dependent DNA helicase DinG
MVEKNSKKAGNCMQSAVPITPIGFESFMGFPALVPFGQGWVSDVGGYAPGHDNTPVIVCYAPALTHVQTGLKLDVLELAAFVMPTAGFAPNLKGLCLTLGADCPTDARQQATALKHVACTLLEKAVVLPDVDDILRYLAMTGWDWAPLICQMRGMDTAHLGPKLHPEKLVQHPLSTLERWNFAERDDPHPTAPLNPQHVAARLDEMVAHTTHAPERRRSQYDFAVKVAETWRNQPTADGVSTALLEAPTGTGKTLGYLAAAVEASQTLDEQIWVSTYTKNLQKQIEQTLDRLPVKVSYAIRKGRENYLCLNKFEDAARKGQDKLIGFVARWLQATKHGDVMSGDFPRWLPVLLQSAPISSLTDKQGECLFSACPHYRKCFIEKSIQKGREADVVIANHALTIYAGRSGMRNGPSPLPRLAVFDEAHHLFDAADQAFAVFISGRELRELSGWIGQNSQDGIMGRVEKYGAHLPGQLLGEYVQKVASYAGELPQEGWLKRIQSGQELTLSERFLSALLAYARGVVPHQGAGHAVEAPLPPDAATQALIREMEIWQDGLNKALGKLEDYLLACCEEIADDAADIAQRLTGVCRAISMRLEHQLRPWHGLLAAAGGSGQFVDWVEVVPGQNGLFDVGLKRHWVNPMVPFSTGIMDNMGAVAMTSATLRASDAASGWVMAQKLCGILKPDAAALEAFPQVLDYKNQAIALIVTDVDWNNSAVLAKAMSTLFAASKGGGLGLFTSIRRLKESYPSIYDAMARRNISLFAQHIDPLDNGSLVEMFSQDENSCLLGTDAMRQGVDVPGRSLRLVVYDKVPRAVPSLLFKARVDAFGNVYRQDVTRRAIRQAFGRLVRSQHDRGVFVILDGRTNSAELQGIPQGVKVQRVTLHEAAQTVQRFLA